MNRPTLITIIALILTAVLLYPVMPPKKTVPQKPKIVALTKTLELNV